MNDKIIKILKIASKLDGAGFKDQASSLDKCASNLNLIKQAQYDGVQGYWVRNSRCWQNCYRQKRSSNPDKPIQEVWNDCHSEFIGSLYGGEGSDWGKYASQSNDIKIASKDQAKLINTQFDKMMDDLMASGENVESAVAGAIIKQCSSYTDLVSEISISILKVAEDIKSNNMSDAMSLVDVSGALTKEAQGFFRKLLDTLKGGVSYGKDAIGDSRVRGTLERLSDNAVAQLQNFYDAMKGFNDVVQETLNVARTATDSGSARLKDAGEETIQLLDNVSIQYDIRPVLDRIRNLPYSRWTIPNEDVGLSESDPMPSLEEGVGSLPDTIEDSGAVGSDVDIDTEVSPSASSGSPSEFISDNIDTAKDVATTLLNNMNQSEEGQEQIMKLISGLGIRMSSLNDLSFNLKKESQFRDQSAMLEKERSMDALRAQRDAIKDRPKKEMDMKKDMMMGLVKRNPYRFLTELMNILGKSQFISFLNNAVKDDASRGSGGRFRKKIKGTFEDIGGSLDL